MRERNYGRIVLTTSSSGLFGNFGQANYGAAKTGMVGLMNVLAEEGRKNNIRVNIISPTAATRMTEELLPPQALALMRPEAITPAVQYLLSEDAPTRTIMGAGAGSFAVIKIMETEGINLAQVRLDARTRSPRISPRSATCRRRRRCRARSSRPRNMSRRPRRGRGSSCRTGDDLILRSLRSKRLEGWTQRMDSRPSFETRAMRAPQDEDFRR